MNRLLAPRMRRTAGHNCLDTAVLEDAGPGTESRSPGHARGGFLSRLLRREDPFTGPAADLQDEGDTMVMAEALEPLPPWKGAPQPAEAAEPDEGAWYGATLTDPVTPVPRRYAPAPVPVLTPRDAFLDARADLDNLPLFRGAVHKELMRRDAAQGYRLLDGRWQARYARTWYERMSVILTDTPVPDFALGRWDGYCDDLVAHALRTVDAEWAARHAAPDGEAEVAA